MMEKKLFGSLVILMLALCGMTMVSCSSSDDDEEITDITSADIVGKWILQEAGGERYGSNFYAVFSANGTFECTPKGNPFGISDSGSWKVSDGKVILNNRTSLTIVKLTSSAMTLKMGDLTMKFQRDPKDKSENSSAMSSTAKQLVGKWLERKYVFSNEVSKTYTGSDRYLLLNADYTFTVNPATVFEDEKRGGGKWEVVTSSKTNILKFSDGSKYKIEELTSTTLRLGWIEEEGYVREHVTFEKQK